MPFEPVHDPGAFLEHVGPVLATGDLMTTDYLGAAKEGDLVEARTEVERLGGTLAFADCSLTVEDREIVRGRAVFAVLSEDDG
jgi:acyl-coenzyme A thioesterase PaaI-like protein